MSETPRVRKSDLLTAIRKVVDHPELIGDHMSKGTRRGFLLFLVSGIAIQTWALIPTTVPAGIYVALPDMAKVTAVAGDSPRRGVATGPIDVRSFVSTESVDFKTFAGARVGLAPGPQMAANPGLFGALGEVPVKAKLQALLILLSSRFGDRDVSALIDKLRALLALPDSALVAVLGLPEMRDLSRMLDAASLGTVDLPRIKTEMGKIALTSAPETPYQVEIAVNGRPTASVDMRYVRSASAESLAASTPATAPAMAPAGFVNVEPGVSIVASAVTVSVMRAAEPVAAAPMLMTVAAPEVFAATLETVPAPTIAPAPVTIAPETFAPTTVIAAPETFTPPTMTAAPETFTPTIETFAPETFAPETLVPSVISTPEPTESAPSTVDYEAPGTATLDEDLSSEDTSVPRSEEPQGGQDNSSSSDSSSSNGADSTASSASGQGGAEAGGDASAGGRETGGGNDSSSGGDGSGGGSASP
ncbi:MAG: hypothetical protein HZB45_02870 [Mycolicibacterium rufum]|nr:hypothetical protein [Mycolicibacterium rufum]